MANHVEARASAASDSRTRLKLFRLAYDAAVSGFSGRQQLYQRYCSGDPNRLASALYQGYDKDTYIDRVHAMLDHTEDRMSSGPQPYEFGPRPRFPSARDVGTPLPGTRCSHWNDVLQGTDYRQYCDGAAHPLPRTGGSDNA